MIHYVLRGTFQVHYKITLVDKIKTLDNKIKANQAEHDLDQKTGIISALSSGEMEKYE